MLRSLSSALYDERTTAPGSPGWTWRRKFRCLLLPKYVLWWNQLVFVKEAIVVERNNGTWIPWMVLEKEVPLPPTAKVCFVVDPAGVC